MLQTRIMMGMPVTVEVVDPEAAAADIDAVYAYFDYVDHKFSTYKDNSEISAINRGELQEAQYSDDMREVFLLSEETRQRTNGFFDIHKPDGSIDPSGLVKGWAIYNAAKILRNAGFINFYVEAGGDVQTAGSNAAGKPWTIGIRNPFSDAAGAISDTIVKTVRVSGEGVATSGSYIRGAHIYNPAVPGLIISDIVSLTVIGPNIYEADRFATAAFAMGTAGIDFIEQLPGFEGYQISADGIATFTSGFEKYSNENFI